MTTLKDSSLPESKFDNDVIIKSLIHLEYMNDIVNQINLYKKNICKDIYKKYIVKTNKELTYKQFYSIIFKNNRLI
jgi:hypothetical protein